MTTLPALLPASHAHYHHVMAAAGLVMLRRQRGGGEPPSPEELRLAVDAQRCLQEVAMLLPPKVCSSMTGPITFCLDEIVGPAGLIGKKNVEANSGFLHRFGFYVCRF